MGFGIGGKLRFMLPLESRREIRFMLPLESGNNPQKYGDLFISTFEFPCRKDCILLGHFKI